MHKLYIGGGWLEAISGKSFEVMNPATNEVVGVVAQAGREDTLKAINVAEQAFQQWRDVLPKEKSKILRKFYEAMCRDKEEIAKLIVLEQGKSIHEARIEVDYAASFAEWFAEEAKRIYGDIVPHVKPGQRMLTYKEPVGVVAAITPWNFPAAMIARKVCPAIAAGCTVVIKPSEETPLTAFYLARLLEEAGLPAGVLNIVCGDAPAIGDALTESNIVRLLTFTGSTNVGKMLMAKSSNTVKKVALELGGNAPFIVFEDADIEKAVSGLFASKIRGGGQSCICVNRVFVHEKIIDSFTSMIVDEFKKIKVGSGLDESVTVGPLINKTASNKIHAMIKDAVEHGSKIIYQDSNQFLTESFCAPAVIVNIRDDIAISRGEIFGPVVSIFSFKDEDEVVKRANATEYGLAGYFYTEDRHRIHRVAHKLEYGMVGVNSTSISNYMTSFGGVKESGLGREGGRSGILEFLEDKCVVIE